MSNDLVQRLRDLGERVSFGHVVPPAGTYMLKAANHIEELNRAFEAYATEMVARVDELESVLKEIADHNRHGWTMQTEIARAALGGKDGK